LRSLAHVSIGKIANRKPDLLKKDVTHLHTFFEALSNEDGENRLAVQEALSMMRKAFLNLDAQHSKFMEALIMQNIEKESPQARRISVQYAAAVFPCDHMPSRYALLLASSDSKEETAMEAMKALRPYDVSLQEESHEKETVKSGRLMPLFGEMVAFMQQKVCFCDFAI
jgi:proteasome component ECM29